MGMMFWSRRNCPGGLCWRGWWGRVRLVDGPSPHPRPRE